MDSKWTLVAAVTATLLALPAASSAQESRPAPCATESHRQFDFWVGKWEVTNAQGNLAGTNRITSILGGCVLLEEWESARGPYAGKSLNTYDAARDRWHQTWVDSRGLLLQLDGGLEGGSMVLRGERPGPDGAVVHHRITWEPLDGDEVRQTWETSSDAGRSWSTQFDGRYVRQD